VLALTFRAGTSRFALATSHVLEVLANTRLRGAPLAPRGVVGLLPFRGALTPVVDLCLLLADRPTAQRRSSRIIVCRLGATGASRLIGLLAEDVLELIELGATLTGLHLPQHDWLGDHLLGAAELPQLIEPAKLLPDELAALFVPERAS
jgi:chemotaxis-related protein WspB